MFAGRLQGKPVLVADVSDAGVGVALATIPSEGPVKMHASLHATPSLEDRSPEQLRAAVMGLFKETANTLLTSHQKKNAVMPHAVHIMLHAPWTRFRTARADSVFEKEQVITKETIAESAKKALVTPSELDRSNILEAGVMQVFLNGYPTGKPLGKGASSIGVVAFESDIDPTVKQTITEQVHALLPDRPLSIYSGTRTLLTVMQEHLPDVHRFFLIAIGGATTTCAVIRKEAVTQHAIAPEGFSTILKRVAGGGLPEETISHLRMLATDTCSSSACEALKSALARAEPDLVRAFGEVFTTLAKERRLPNTVILASPAELAPWLQTFFSRIDFSQFTTTTQPFTVETLTPDHLATLVAWDEGVVADTGLGLAALTTQLLAQST